MIMVCLEHYNILTNFVNFIFLFFFTTIARYPGLEEQIK